MKENPKYVLMDTEALRVIKLGESNYRFCILFIKTITMRSNYLCYFFMNATGTFYKRVMFIKKKFGYLSQGDVIIAI